MVQKVHLIIKGMNGDYDLKLYFLLEDKLDNSDCGLTLFKEGYNEMEHFWHYFDVIYVKQYFQEKTGLVES